MKNTCNQCEGKGKYWGKSGIDSMFQELKYCRECKGTGKAEVEGNHGK